MKYIQRGKTPKDDIEELQWRNSLARSTYTEDIDKMIIHDSPPYKMKPLEYRIQ